MLDPLPRRYHRVLAPVTSTVSSAFPNGKWVGFPHLSRLKRLRAGGGFRGRRYFVMFRPPSLLAPQIVPTAANTAAGQPGLLRPGTSCFVASARTGYANRPNSGNWRCRDSHPARLRPCRLLLSSIPPIIPYGRFSRVRLEGWLVRRGLPGASFSLSLLPACTDRRPFAFALRAPRGQHRLSRTEPGRGLDDAPPWRVGCPPPQGSSLRIGLCCPSPSSLNRPHPPRSQAHRDFTALRLIRDAFAVRERLGDPRAVPGFCYHSLLACHPL